MFVKAAEQLNRIRRRAAQLSDQTWVIAANKLRSDVAVESFDGQPRFALLTVNCSTTRYLKLMLRTLVEQDDLDLIASIIICDNRSRDGGVPFLRDLARKTPLIELVEKKWWTNHASGMRAARRALIDWEANVTPASRANILLACDPDVIFLRDDALTALAQVFRDDRVAFSGQLRRHLFPLPEVQASFLAMRRDWAERTDVSPWVNHGSPAWRAQRDIWRRGGKGADFPAFLEGYVLHRGRSSVAAAGKYAPLHSYATTSNREPHFMGIPNGAQIWHTREKEFSRWLEPESEPDLIRLLSSRLG